MKTKFYTLPKAERVKITDEIEKLTISRDNNRDAVYRYKNLLEDYEYKLKVVEEKLNALKNKYDWD